MAEIGYTRGQTTFTAAEDLEKFRLVRVTSGSSTVPVEVEYTDTGVVMGVTDESAKAGELVSIKPLNIEGTYEFEAATSNITVGAPVFINTAVRDGRVTEQNTGFYVGQSADNSVAGEHIEVGGVVGVIGSGDASNITIQDQFNYYTVDTVEGALEELGNTLNAREIVARQSILYMLRTDASFLPLNAAENGGLISSNSSDIILDVDGTTSAWRATANGADVYLNIQAAMPPQFINQFSLVPEDNHPFVFGFTGYTLSTNWSATYSLNFINDDGTPLTLNTASQPIVMHTSPIENAVISIASNIPDGINTANKALSVSINLHLENPTDAVANPLYIYNLYFKYDRVVI